MKTTGSEAIVKSLIAEGTDTIFGYPGGSIMPFYDALYNYKKEINHVLTRHEQGSVHAAEGYAYVSDKVGVCISTSGPGATNLTTGIFDAMMDSVPIVCITGQVPAEFIGSNAFQEADVIQITKPITKWNYQITKASEIPEIIHKAFYIAKSGRPGPVVIDIAKNAQVEKINFEPYSSSYSEIKKLKDQISIDTEKLKKAANLINNAKKPMIYTGHGIVLANAENLLKELTEKSGIPVASTLLGLSTLPTDHTNYVGMLGMHGNYAPNMLSNKADVILALGMRFDDRVTGKLENYLKSTKIIHVDIDPKEINKRVKNTVSICTDVKKFLKNLSPLIKANKHSDWLNKFKVLEKKEKEEIDNKELSNPKKFINLASVVDLLSKKTNGNALIVTDVGQHQMKTAKYYKFKKENSFVTSGGSGTMGYGLPALIGAKYGAKNRTAIAIVGDGGFQMTLQELETVRKNNLDIKIIIARNNFLGMVRQWQELFFNKRYSQTNLSAPDFTKIASAYNIKAKSISKKENVSKAIDEMLKFKGPYLLDIQINPQENVFPIIPPGASIDEIRLK